MTYRGRFAPSPTGPLHFGSLVAAVGSYLQAKSVYGQWLLRIEDLDSPRTVSGAADSILRTLELMGFEWNEAVLYQSTRTAAYEAALQQLQDAGLCYPCSCTRSELLSVSGTLHDGDELHYSGWCRSKPRRDHGPYAWRFRIPSMPIEFFDALRGPQQVDLAHNIGDFVIKRRDGLFAYQLAVVVDDAAQSITEVVRGVDLLSNTPRQIALQRALDLHTPAYVHLPLVMDTQGRKLSKASAALELQPVGLSAQLWQALHFLRQNPPIELQTAALSTLWSWATTHWQLSHLTDNCHVTL